MIDADLTTDDMAAALHLNKPTVQRLRSDFPKPISMTNNYDQWEKLLLAEDNLANAPTLSLEAMRRESMYEERL